MIIFNLNNVRGGAVDIDNDDSSATALDGEVGIGDDRLIVASVEVGPFPILPDNRDTGREFINDQELVWDLNGQGPGEAIQVVSRTARDFVVFGRGRRSIRNHGDWYYRRLIFMNHETYQDARLAQNYIHMNELVEFLILRFRRRCGNFLSRRGPGVYVLAHPTVVARKFHRDLAAFVDVNNPN